MRRRGSMPQVVCYVLEEIVKNNEKNFGQYIVYNPSSPFFAPSAPEVSVVDYMARIMKFAPLSDELLIMSLIYLDRFMERNTDTLLSRLNIHRLMLTSVVLSAKFNSDFFYTNSYYAHVGGVTCLEMNALERTFLTKLNYHLTVQKEEFTVYHNEMLKHAAKAQARFVRKNETSAIPQPVNQGAPPVAVAMPATQVSQMVVDSRQQRPITDQVPPASGVCTQQAAATSFEQHLIQGQVC
jgi:hypothetical protein